MSTVTIISQHGINNSVLMATADQVTVVGNGTLELPLRVAGGGASFIAEYTDLTLEPPNPGRPVVVDPDAAGDPAIGITSVRLGTAGLPTPRPFVVGLIIAAREVGGVREVTVQHAGTVTLTTTQWDLVTGQTGGLTPGSPYYLSFGFDDLGHLTKIVVSDVGRFVVLAGIALDEVTMQLALPQLPLEVA
jgi:hypothetical protein